MSVDRIICAVALALAALYLFGISKIPTLEIGDPLGPKAFPRLLAGGLVLSAVLLFVETLRGRKTQAASEGPAHWRLVFTVVVWTVAYFYLFEKLGYVLATTGYLLPLMHYFNRGRKIANTATAVLFPLLSYLAFTKALGVALPQGVLPF